MTNSEIREKVKSLISCTILELKYIL